jgi:hypothetical protein
MRTMVVPKFQRKHGKKVCIGAATKMHARVDHVWKVRRPRAYGRVARRKHTGIAAAQHSAVPCAELAPLCHRCPPDGKKILMGPQCGGPMFIKTKQLLRLRRVFNDRGRGVMAVAKVDMKRQLPDLRCRFIACRCP